MQRFFLPETPAGEIIEVTGADAFHIGYSLRMKPGEELIFTRDGIDYLCEIAEIEKNLVTAKIIGKEAVKSEPPVKVTLFQALPKSDKMEMIIEKCTELGACEFVPFVSKRCVAKPKSTKLTRWQSIAESAAKQSGRGIIPKVFDTISFSALVEKLKDFDIVYFCNENADPADKLALPDSKPKKIGLVVGSEGGFELSEAEALIKAGAKSVTLGKRILRCETAPIAALSIIIYLAE